MREYPDMAPERTPNSVQRGNQRRRSARAGNGRFAVTQVKRAVWLEPYLAVRGLPPALAVAVLFLFEQLDGRGGHRFVDVAAAEAGAVLTVPVPLWDHRATTARTVPRQDKLYH